MLHRKRDGYPPPRRARENPWVALNPQDQQSLDKESNLILRVLLLLLIGQLHGFNIKFGLEHPEDPESDPEKKKRWLTPKEASNPCCSFWVSEVFKKCKKALGGTLQSFDQGALGHLTQKSTSFWTNLVL